MKCREKLDPVLMRKYSQTEQKKNEAKKISSKSRAKLDSPDLLMLNPDLLPKNFGCF